MRETSATGTVALSLSIGSGITLSDPTAGQFTIEITDTQTLALDPAKKYVYQLRATLGDVTSMLIAGDAVNVIAKV